MEVLPKDDRKNESLFLKTRFRSNRFGGDSDFLNFISDFTSDWNKNEKFEARELRGGLEFSQPGSDSHLREMMASPSFAVKSTRYKEHG
jgi:hypothetical protein